VRSSQLARSVGKSGAAQALRRPLSRLEHRLLGSGFEGRTMATIRQPGAPRNQLERDLAELAHVRDEIRLKLHLCGMDLRSSWRKLDKQLELLEERLGREGDHVARATRDMARDLKESFVDLKRRLT
jgi:hypothetical protein